jgi:hypothetical protein
MHHRQLPDTATRFDLLREPPLLFVFVPLNSETLTRHYLLIGIQEEEGRRNDPREQPNAVTV